MPAAVMPGVVVRQRKPWRRKDGLFIYFEGERRRAAELERALTSPLLTDNAGVIVNPKGEMKGAFLRASRSAPSLTHPPPRLRHHRPCRQGGCRPLASRCRRRQLHRLGSDNAHEPPRGRPVQSTNLQQSIVPLPSKLPHMLSRAVSRDCRLAMRVVEASSVHPPARLRMVDDTRRCTAETDSPRKFLYYKV